MRFRDKSVIVTGGASGIGEASARLFAEEGAKVVIADYSDSGRAIAADIPDAIFVKTDVTDSEQVQTLMQRTAEAFGRIDVLFANAGIAADGPVSQLTEEAWRRTIDINLTGVFLCDKYAAEQMIRQGSGAIVNCGSIHSHVGRSGVTAYAAAKGGVKLLTQTLSIDLASRGIRVNAVCPGYIDTPLLAKAPPELISQLKGLHPMGRLGEANEVAKAVLFLASEDASFITGSCLMVDGGYTAQ